MEKFIVALLWDDEERWGIQHFRVDANDLKDAVVVAAHIIAAEVYSFYEIAYILSKDSAHIFSGSYSGSEFKKRKEVRMTEAQIEDYRKQVALLKQNKENTKKQLERRIGNIFDEKNYIGPILD